MPEKESRSEQKENLQAVFTSKKHSVAWSRSVEGSSFVGKKIAAAQQKPVYNDTHSGILAQVDQCFSIHVTTMCWQNLIKTFYESTSVT